MKEPIVIAPYEDYHAHSLEFISNEMHNKASLLLKEENEKITHHKGVIPPDAHHLPDAAMKANIESLLRAELGVDLDKVEITVHEGDVIISGVVPENKLARLTEEIEKAGARDIQNRLRSE